MFEKSRWLALRLLQVFSMPVAWPNLKRSRHLMVCTRRGAICSDIEACYRTAVLSRDRRNPYYYVVNIVYRFYTMYIAVVFSWHLPKCKHGSSMPLLFTSCTYTILKSIKMLFANLRVPTYTTMHIRKLWVDPQLTYIREWGIFSC